MFAPYKVKNIVRLPSVHGAHKVVVNAVPLRLAPCAHPIAWHPHCKNRQGGGGGRNSTKRPFYLYVWFSYKEDIEGLDVSEL